MQSVPASACCAETARVRSARGCWFWTAAAGRLVLLLLPRVLPLVALQGTQFAPLGAAQPALRLQLLQAMLLGVLCILRLRIVLLCVLPLVALQRAQFAPLGAAEPALRLQLLQTRVLSGCWRCAAAFALHVLLGLDVCWRCWTAC